MTADAVAGPSEEQTVLHVVDRESGGVPVAVATYVSRTLGDVRHVILAPPTVLRGFSHLPGVELVPFSRWPLGRLRDIRRAVRLKRPSVVHAHSSFPGAYVRTVLSRRKTPIVYTPHCFAFERNGSPALAWVFTQAERLLSRNTSVYAACSPREAALARQVSSGGSVVVYVPNVARAHPASTAASGTTDSHVIMVGRISNQKDPDFFVRVVTDMRRRTPRLQATWVGSGDPAATVRLQANDITVTGWLPEAEVHHLVSDADLLVHTAAWEGLPISVLDAVALGTPVLVRPIPAWGWVPENLTLAAIDDFLGSRVSAKSSAAWAAQVCDEWSALMAENSPECQRQGLLQAWTVSTR